MCLIGPIRTICERTIHLPSQLFVGYLECITARDVTGFKTEAKPFFPLRRGTVSKRIRHDSSPCLPLQGIVTHRGGGSQRFLQISSIENVLGSLRVMSPDAGEEVR